MSESTTVQRAYRHATVDRQTSETEVHIRLGLDGRFGGAVGALSGAEPPGVESLKPGATSAASLIDVPDGFFGHMLDALIRHGGLVAEIEATGDTHIDLHHTVEDVGIGLGEALSRALGDRRGIVRFGHAYAPLDEALSRAVVDLSGRGSFHFHLPPELEHSWVTRTFPLTLLGDFFCALADRGRLTLHLDVLRGRNPHHVAEASFKAVAQALRQAVARRVVDGVVDGAVPSTKGTLSELP